MAVAPRSQGSSPGSFLRALRPALWGAAATGVLPLSCTDGSWKLWSLTAARGALAATLLLGLYAACLVSQPGSIFTFSSTIGVYMTLRFLVGPLRWLGSVVWVWAHAPQLEAFNRACRQYEENFGSADLRPTTRYVRRYAICAVLVTAVYMFLVAMYYAQYPVWFQVAMVVSLNAIEGGVIFWTIILSGTCSSLADAFRGIDAHLQTALRKRNVPLLRRLTRQHGQISQLISLFCRTYGGFLAAFVYAMLFEISLSIYVHIRPFSAVEGVSLVRVIMERLFAPLPLILLKLMTNAGHGLIQQSQQAADLLRNHMLASSQAADDPDFTEILHNLEGQQVRMYMAGYLTLDGELFIQSVKDIATMVIALAQFDMVDPNVTDTEIAPKPQSSH